MSVTAKELARQLGLSPAAVSMALGGKHGVSEATRERVLAAARAQGYDFSRTRLVGCAGKSPWSSTKSTAPSCPTPRFLPS